MSKANIDTRRRRIAISLCILGFVLWTTFAIKDHKSETQILQADDGTRGIVTKHLEAESRTPLFGEININLGGSDD